MGTLASSEYKRVPLFSRTKPCPDCVIELVDAGYGDYKELFECYCEKVGELPFAPRKGEKVC